MLYTISVITELPDSLLLLVSRQSGRMNIVTIDNNSSPSRAKDTTSSDWYKRDIMEGELGETSRERSKGDTFGAAGMNLLEDLLVSLPLDIKMVLTSFVKWTFWNESVKLAVTLRVYEIVKLYQTMECITKGYVSLRGTLFELLK